MPTIAPRKRRTVTPAYDSGLVASDLSIRGPAACPPAKACESARSLASALRPTGVACRAYRSHFTSWFNVTASAASTTTSSGLFFFIRHQRRLAAPTLDALGLAEAGLGRDSMQVVRVPRPGPGASARQRADDEVAVTTPAEAVVYSRQRTWTAERPSVRNAWAGCLCAGCSAAGAAVLPQPRSRGVATGPRGESRPVTRAIAGASIRREMRDGRRPACVLESCRARFRRAPRAEFQGTNAVRLALRMSGLRRRDPQRRR